MKIVYFTKVSQSEIIIWSFIEIYIYISMFLVNKFYFAKIYQSRWNFLLIIAGFWDLISFSVINEKNNRHWDSKKYLLLDMRSTHRWEYWDIMQSINILSFYALYLFVCQFFQYSQKLVKKKTKKQRAKDYFTPL